MTAETIYRLLCDAPTCGASAIVERISTTPEGWARINSTDHLADWKPGQKLRLANGRTKADQRTLFDMWAGSFSVHLCPSHLDVFDGHRPRTEGTTAERRTGDRHVTVRCSCDWAGASVRDLLLVSKAPGPNRTPERAWWRHLPEELRWYAAREAVPA